MSLPTKPNPVYIEIHDTIGFILDMRLRAVRTDTDKVLMDFVMRDLMLNFTMSLSQGTMSTDSTYVARFQKAEMIERG